MKAIIKSIAAGVIGMALFFFFFMTLTIPVLMVMARLHNSSAPLQAPDVVLTPGPLFRYVGLPLSAAAFVASFLLAMRKFKNQERHS